MPPSPKVSIILPTCNRVDVLGRAVDSVRRQSCLDWELIVVDAGSTDGTAAWLATLRDERIRVLRQDNAGACHARNAGLRAAQGAYIAFIDADDEWYPHFLALTTAFLDAHAQQMFVTTEFHRREQVFDQAAVPACVHMARSLGLFQADILEPKADDYLRIYRRSEVVGSWGQRIVHKIGRPAARVYRGQIFRHLRWGHLNGLPVTLLRREALETIGEFSTATHSAADFRFLALLCQHYPAAMIAVPSARRHDNAADGRKLPCDHLASVAGAHRFEVNRLKHFHELFHSVAPHDPELQVIRRYHQLCVGRTALAAGLGEEARRHLAQALSWRPALWDAAPLWLLAHLAPTASAGAAVLRTWETLLRATLRLNRDPAVVGVYLRRLFSGRFRTGAAGGRPPAAPVG